MIKLGRTLFKFAFLPTKMSSGEWIWLTMFMKHQEKRKVWQCVNDMGWPDIGTWGWVDRWVTTGKSVLIKEKHLE